MQVQTIQEIEKQMAEEKAKKLLYHKIHAQKQRRKKGFCSRCGSLNIEYKKYKSCKNCRIQSNNYYYLNKNSDKNIK